MRKGQNVYKRKDGRWEARIPIGKLNGKMQYKSLYASTYRQALQRKRDFEHKNNKVPSEPVHVTTYRDIATAWMRENSGSWKQSLMQRIKIIWTVIYCLAGVKKLFLILISKNICN